VPFTFSHPAAILPLSRLPRWLVIPSALAIGSLSPDFWYILPGFGRESGHNLVGIFRFCLPAGLGLWLGWRLLLGPSLAILLPTAPRHAVRDYLHQWRLSDLWAAPLSVIVGAITHVAWDRWAHDNHAELIPVPHGRVHLLGHHPEVWQILQLGSSILGLALLVAWFLIALRRLCPTATWAQRLWPGQVRALALAALFVGPLIVSATLRMPLDASSLHEFRAGFLPTVRLFLPLLAGSLFTWSALVLIARTARTTLRRT
jgi:hypothetical protein